MNQKAIFRLIKHEILGTAPDCWQYITTAPAAVLPDEPPLRPVISRPLKAVCAAAVCLSLTIAAAAGLFAVNLPSRPGAVSHDFALTACAANVSDSGTVLLGSTALRLQNARAFFTEETLYGKQIWHARLKSSSVFNCTGKGIEQVRYTAKDGSLSNFDLVMLKDKYSGYLAQGYDEFTAGKMAESDVTVGKSLKDGKTIKVKPGNPVTWYPCKRFASGWDAPDYSKLPGDTIAVSVTFKDGSAIQKTVLLSFADDGTMLAKVTDKQKG